MGDTRLISGLYPFWLNRLVTWPATSERSGTTEPLKPCRDHKKAVATGWVTPGARNKLALNGRAGQR